MVASTPADRSFDVATDATISVTFSHGVDANTVTPDTWKVWDNAGARIDGAFAVVGRTIAFTPTSPLQRAMEHELQITNVKDTSGAALRFARLQFTTASQHGGLDPSFGDHGAAPQFGIDIFDATMALQADGKIVAGVRGALVRYTAEGAFDPSFGSGGSVTSNLSGILALQPDGRILAAGGTNNSDRIVVARYNNDGSVDQAFGANGRFTTSLGAAPRAVALQPDGRIIVAGTYPANGDWNDTDFVLFRLLPDGALDASFGAGGYVTTGFTSVRDQPTAVAVLADGAILVSGTSQAAGDDLFVGGYALVQGLLARYTPQGALDIAFGTGGKVVTSFDTGRALAVQSDGRIVTAARQVVRYLANGAIDSAFGTGGQVPVHFRGADDVARAITLRSNGHIVVAGATGLGRRFGLAELQPSGAVDATFGNAGSIVTSMLTAGLAQHFTAIGLQADGKLVCAGIVRAPLSDSLGGVLYVFTLRVLRYRP